VPRSLVDPERAVTRAMTLGETNREFLEAAWSAATAGADTPSTSTPATS
jgi:transcription-repair coupling factor (superfamily II helicase)